MSEAQLPSDAIVVVRAFDEEATLGAVLDDLARHGFEALVVDDGSQDDTARIARGHGVRLVRHPVNLGPGAALATGLAAAVRSRRRFVATFDADGQHGAADLVRCLAPLARGDADVVFGSRFLRREDRRLMPRGRRWLLRGARLVDGLLTGRWLSDAHNGLRAMTREAARRIALTENGHAYASELLAETRRLGLRLVEVPVAVRYSTYSRRKGQSGWNSLNVLFDYLGGKLLR